MFYLSDVGRILEWYGVTEAKRIKLINEGRMITWSNSMAKQYIIEGRFNTTGDSEKRLSRVEG